MIKRRVSDACFSPEFGRQMRFIAGPRQTGKTTLAKIQLETMNCSGLYYNCDSRDIRNSIKSKNYFYENDIYDIKPTGPKYWAAFDEIHKLYKWKNILKDYFDKSEGKFTFIITGSARLDLFRKSGDSLAGRYFLFHLHPFCLSELCSKDFKRHLPLDNALPWIEQVISHQAYEQQAMEQMLAYSGFPEPCLSSNNTFYAKWRPGYTERLLREDLRDLTRIHDLDNIAVLLNMLPSRVMSPLSLNSLREDLNISYSAVKNYLRALELGYVIFYIRPYSRKIPRAVIKEAKCYLYDFAVIQDPAARFENFIALEMKMLLDWWNDAGLGEYELFFIKTKDGRETDFLITQERKPWLLLEAKLSETKFSPHHYAHSTALGNIPIIQLVKKTGVLIKKDNTFIISASRFF